MNESVVDDVEEDGRVGLGKNGVVRVGIVDDHQMFLDGIARWLEDATTDLRVEVSVTSWAELVSHPGFPVDVIVLDLDLKDDVPPTVKISTGRAAGAEVVIVSGFGEAATVRACLAAGASGYVAKSDDAAAVAAAVTAAAGGEQYLSPALATLLLEGSDVNDVPALSPQEVRALTLYTSGLPLKSVARQMGVAYETAKSYLDRVRDKYALAGRDARTKLELRSRAVQDGHLTLEGTARIDLTSFDHEHIPED